MVRKAIPPIEPPRRFHFQVSRKSQSPSMITLSLPVLLIQPTSHMTSFQDTLLEFNRLIAKLKAKMVKPTLSIKTTRATSKASNSSSWTKCQLKNASGSSLNSTVLKVSLFGLQVSSERLALCQKLIMFNSRNLSTLSK